MKETPTKENTLYLPIKQIYFDQIIEGTKKYEYREIKEGITANRYLIKDNDKKYILNSDVTEEGKEYFIDDYNEGNFPFMPKPYKYLSLAVGYAKERDTAIVEVIGYSFEPHLIRANLYAYWTIVYHLGEIIEVHRVGEKKQKAQVEGNLPKNSDVHQSFNDAQDTLLKKDKNSEVAYHVSEASRTIEKPTNDESITDASPISPIPPRTKVFYKECAVAGWNFQEVDDFWSELDEGVGLALIRQKYNKYDRYAVAVAFADDYNGSPEDFDFNLIIGYVPRTENQFIAQMMDLGYTDMFVAEITTVKNHGKYDDRLRMTIYIQSKEGFEDKAGTKEILYAMRMSEERYEFLTKSLKDNGCVQFRWGGFPPSKHDLPDKGDHVLCLYERKSEVVVYLMHLIGKDVSASPFLENPEAELDMVDDCCPYVLTNIMGPIILPVDELSFLDDEGISFYQPDQRLSQYATIQIKDILLKFEKTTKYESNSICVNHEVLPILED